MWSDLIGNFRGSYGEDCVLFLKKTGQDTLGLFLKRFGWIGWNVKGVSGKVVFVVPLKTAKAAKALMKVSNASGLNCSPSCRCPVFFLMRPGKLSMT